TEGYHVPAGEVYVATESPKGEFGVYLVADGTNKPYRCKIRPTMFSHIQALDMMLKGHMSVYTTAVLWPLVTVCGRSAPCLRRTRWSSVAWTAANAAKAKEIIAPYPEGRQVSAVIPLLDLAQRQVGAETNTQGWLPIPVMEFVARELDTSYIRVLEVATFYTMFNLAPVGRCHVQVCWTPPGMP